MIITHINYKA
jgi:hypothetical protein